jgi:hypothetical protein
MTWDILALVILTMLIVVLSIYNIKLQMRNRKLVVQLAQEVLNKKIIGDKLNEELAKQDSQALEQSEGFLKFISQSRDWAFDYIEQVQAALLVFKGKVDPQIRYAKTYGVVAGESVHSKIVAEFSEAYDDLLKVMPEDEAKNYNE